ncbi:unnamed protein product [Anisakis simplex]|uniref:Uncharacterized protein n=1 Tax=Anisakis simplex TaxID=6269 RepID=A0A0M3JDN7_ANISI|nr:unnamed protein product [Anisakis simplex]
MKLQLKNDLNLMAHMLSDVHLSMKSMQITDVNHENLKLDLETCIGEVDIKCDDVDDDVQNENDYQKVNSSTVKKKRLRIRQKFIARSKEFDLFIKDHERTELQEKGSGKTRLFF